MARGFARKAFYLALILLGVSILCFALLRLSGRDPALAVALRAQSASEENIAQLREELGLTGTPVQQYFRWLSGFVRGDFGYSIYSGRSVALDIAEKLPVTCALMGLALGWILLLGTPVALCAAYRPGKLFDQIGRVLSILAVCVPTFWLAYMLLVIFAVKIPLITVVPRPGLAGLLMPSLALAIPSAGSYVRVFRASLIRQMGSEYCLVARTRGLNRRQILLSHALRNALPPAVTLLMQFVGYLFTGSVLVESVFSLNGLGSYILNCALASDASALAACLMLAAFVYAVCNMLGEVINILLCPWTGRRDT